MHGNLIIIIIECIATTEYKSEEMPSLADCPLDGNDSTGEHWQLAEAPCPLFTLTVRLLTGVPVRSVTDGRTDRDRIKVTGLGIAPAALSKAINL